MAELKERLERLSEVGTPAGADAIWKRVSQRLAAPPEARVDPVMRPRVQRAPIAVAVSLALVMALLVAGAVVLARTTSRSSPSVVAGSGPSSTQAALDSEHTQTLLAGIDGQRGVEVTDVDQGTTETVVHGPMNVSPCNTCPLVRRGEAVFFARDGRAYILDDPDSSPRDLGPASFVFGGSDHRTVWTATTTRDSGTVTRLDERGNRTGGPWAVPDGYRISLNFLPEEIGGRILLARGPLNPPRALYVWDPESGRRVHVGDALFSIDTYQRQGASVGTLAWIPEESCRTGLRRCALTFSDISGTDGAKNETRTVDAPSESNGFIGGGAFSPDGSTLAAFVAAPPTRQGPAARLVLVDVATGVVHKVRGGEISIGESYGFATWDPTGRWLFFGGFPQPLRVHRNGTDDAVALNLPASYTSVALAAPRPSTTTTSYPRECLRTSPDGGCSRSLKQAQAMLGVPLRSPRAVPDSWVSVRRVVFVTPAGYQGNSDEVAAYNQVWAPPGTDLSSDQADFLQIRQRAALPADANTCVGSPYPLEDGSTACGTMVPATPGPKDYTSLDWVKGGVEYHVQALGVAPEVVLRVLNSLH